MNVAHLSCPLQPPDVTPVQPALSPQPIPTASQVTCMARTPNLLVPLSFHPNSTYQHGSVVVFSDVTAGSIHCSIALLSLHSILEHFILSFIKQQR